MLLNALTGLPADLQRRIIVISLSDAVEESMAGDRMVNIYIVYLMEGLFEGSLLDDPDRGRGVAGISGQSTRQPNRPASTIRARVERRSTLRRVIVAPSFL